MDSPSSPRTAYSARLEQRQLRVAHQARLDARIALARLVVFAVAVALGLLAWRTEIVTAAWIGLPALAFVALMVWHDRVLTAKARAERAVDFYQRGLDRLDDKWAGSGNQTADFVDDEHPFAADLDLFGPGSLFELLCNARTRAGQATLASWLCEAAPLSEVETRQQAVEELRGKLDLREALSLLGSDLRAGVRTEALAAWGREPAKVEAGGATRMRLTAFGLTLLAGLGLYLWAQLAMGPWLLIGTAFAIWLYGRLLQGRLSAMTAMVEQREEELTLLSKVLERLEQEPLSSSHLVQLQAELSAEGRVASRCLRVLSKRLIWHSAQRNQFFAPFAFALMWNVHFSLAIEAWRAHCGGSIQRWLDAVGALEALSDLAGYAFEHPQDPFPSLSDEAPRFDGRDLGHPLLPESRCIRNSVRLDSERRVLLVSGSNMSGKTTLLRTVGVNAVLALCGAPVRASALTISSLRIGATLRIHDSIQKGTSRFYAEIRRLKQLMDMATGEHPLLFLLDEVLHGTNSHDRRVGAEALIRGYIAKRAIGLATTHDLALAEVVDALGQSAANVHFADQLEDGQLSFDYRMREGVVRRSNAIALMQSIGLEV